MNNKTFEISLDVEKELYQGSVPLFTVSRNDFETIDLLFTITQDDARFNLTGTEVEMAIKKPSGLTVYQQCSVTQAVSGEVTARLSIQGYMEFGIHTAEVYIRTGNQLAVTCPFYYSSREAVMETQEVESVNDWSALQQALFAYDLKPLISMGFPTAVPEYVGQMAFDIANRLTYIASDLTAGAWQLIGTGEGGAGGGNDTIIGTGAPFVSPIRLGQIYIDTEASAIYVSSGSTANDWERVDNDDLVAVVSWNDISGKPDVYPTNFNDPNFNTAVAGAIPAEYLTTAEGDARYLTDAEGDARYLTAIPDEYLTRTEADDTYLYDVPAEYLTQTEGDARYLTAVPAEYLTDVEADANYKAIDAPVEPHTHTIADVTNLQTALNAKADDTDLANYSPINHTHTIANVTGLQGALDTKVDDTDLAGYAPVNHTHTIANVTGLQGALDGKADDADLAGYAPIAHTHGIIDVNGLQAALDNKADDVDLEGLATYDMVYVKSETYNKTEIDQMTMGTGGGSPVIIEDNLASTSTTNALSANQGRILNNTKASTNHTHTTAQITDFATGVSANIPPEYLTQTEGDARYLTAVPDAYLTDVEGDARYAPTGNYLTAIPPEYLTDTEGDARYAPAGTYLTDVPAEYLTETEGDARYAPTGNYLTAVPAEYLTATEGDTAYAPKTHTHTVSQITDFASGVAANIPATYATDAEVSANYQPKGTYLTAVPLMTGGQIGGAMVGNGLAMSTNYLYVKTGAGLGIAGDNTVQVQTTNTTPTPVRFWTGTQATYNGLTKDANTLYFITG